MKYMKLTYTAMTPTRATPGSAGLDLYADTECLLVSDHTNMVGTGIAVEIPLGYVGLLFLRSSMGSNGVKLTNAVGVIDSDYRGEIKLCLTYAHEMDVYHIQRGDRIAQLVVMPVASFDLTEVDALSSTDRGTGGFGSTGK
jgi:dUTP pyrophosphatase